MPVLVVAADAVANATMRLMAEKSDLAPVKRNPSCGISSEMDQSCGTESPLYRCFRDIWIRQMSDVRDHIWHQPCGTNLPLIGVFVPRDLPDALWRLAISSETRPHCRPERGIAPFRRGKAHRSSAVLRSVAVSVKCIAIANSGFSGGAVRSTTGGFGGTSGSG